MNQHAKLQKMMSQWDKKPDNQCRTFKIIYEFYNLR